MDRAILRAAQIFPDITWCACWRLRLFLWRLKAVKKLLAASLGSKVRNPRLVNHTELRLRKEQSLFSQFFEESCDYVKYVSSIKAHWHNFTGTLWQE